jgi:hypothetical protein
VDRRLDMAQEYRSTEFTSRSLAIQKELRRASWQLVPV